MKRSTTRLGRVKGSPTGSPSGSPSAGKSSGQTRAKFYMTYPKKLVREPLIYWVSRKFDVITNIRSASVSEEIGIIALELDGTPDAIERAVTWFREQGVTVEPIEKNVIE